LLRRRCPRDRISAERRAGWRVGQGERHCRSAVYRDLVAVRRSLERLRNRRAGKYRRSRSRGCVVPITAGCEQKDDQCDKYDLVSRQTVHPSPGNRPFARCRHKGTVASNETAVTSQSVDERTVSYRDCGSYNDVVATPG
jgi:hypothetical protein